MILKQLRCFIINICVNLRQNFSGLSRLGNTRVVLSDNDHDGLSEIIQEDHYYPFGMRLAGQSYTNPLQAAANKYLYNGKELQDDLGLDWYDFGNRFYDPQAPHFTTIDRFAEKYYSLSPYSYAANNPVNIIDVNGDSLELIIGKPYTKNGKEYPYGHVALRVFNSKEGYDKVYDFGRYGETWGLGSGDEILNIYSSSKNYLKSEQKDRNSVGYTFGTSVKEDKKVIAYYQKLAEQGGIYKSGYVPEGGGKAYKLKDDYSVFDNNCTTISASGMGQVGKNVIGKEYDQRDVLKDIEKNFSKLGFVKRTEYLKGGGVKTTYERKPDEGFKWNVNLLQLYNK